MSTSLSVRGAACERFGSGALGAAPVGRRSYGGLGGRSVGARSILRTITIVFSIHFIYKTALFSCLLALARR